MVAHACLKNEFKEDEKCHNLMSWLIYVSDYFSVAAPADHNMSSDYCYVV